MNVPRVSVIFVTYNRAHTLVATVKSLIARLAYPRTDLELIVCDDASDAHNRDIAQRLPVDHVLTAKRNQGLGANTNKGIRAATGDFILQLQDDWLFVGDPQFLAKSIAVLERFPDVSMVTFRERPELGVAETRQMGDDLIDIIEPKLDANGRLAQVSDGTYTDNPHVKRRDFHDIFGLYAEGIPMTKMELAMSRAVAARRDFKVAILRGPATFHHIGDEHSFNPGVLRDRRLRQFRRIPFGAALIDLARAVRGRLKKRPAS